MRDTCALKVVRVKNIVLFFFLSLSWLSTFSKEIYVAKDGSDENAGTLEKPYLTLAKAGSVAAAGDIVFIREGIYEETLAPTNSGVEGNPIVFQSFEGEKVIITAMQGLKNWSLDAGSVFKTSVDWTLEQQNFVMHEQTALDLARWPNNEDGDPFTQNTLRNTGGSGPDVANDAFLEYTDEIPDINWENGGSLYFYGDKEGAGWTTWRSYIKSSTTDKITFDLNKNPSWIRTVHSPKDLGNFFLQGVKGALDFQNEWYFDPVSKTLYVQLPDGAKPADDAIKMRKRVYTVDLRGKNYIELRNLAVFGGSIEISGDGNKIYGVSSFYGNYTLGVVSGFRANSQSVNIIQGIGNVIEKCEIAFGAGTGVWDSGEGSTITNCNIHDFNYLGDYDAVVMIRNGSGTTLSHNTISRGGRDAIQSLSKGVIISYNDVSQSNLIADDCGLFYTVGGPSNSELHHNWFHDAYSSGDKTKAAGIYLDNDSEAFTVHHNVVWNTEWSNIQINWNGKNINIYNNTLWNGSAVMGAWHKEGTQFSKVKVFNNLGDNDEWESQSDARSNIVSTDDPFVNLNGDDFRLKSGTSPVDAGLIIEGITDGYKGNSPDVGAYEFGGKDWRAGIDWETKLGPTGLGCYGLPGEDCADISPEDLDGDGVKNEIDQCPNTPFDDDVDETGCTPLSIVFDKESEKMLIYPNPVEHNSVIIFLPSLKRGGIVWTLYSMNGHKIKFGKIDLEGARRFSIVVSDLATGNYMLKVDASEDTYYERLLKQ